jgi:hypothetical protein
MLSSLGEIGVLEHSRCGMHENGLGRLTCVKYARVTNAPPIKIRTVSALNPVSTLERPVHVRQTAVVYRDEVPNDAACFSRMSRP